MNQNCKNFPATIKKALQEDFHFPAQVLFVQVATQSQTAPHIRSMRLYGVEESEGMIFFTHSGSAKWKDLQASPKVALCFLHPGFRLQLLAECNVRLLKPEANPDLFKKYWQMIKPDVRKIYREDYPINVPFEKNHVMESPLNPPANLGMIIVEPYFWEYMLIGDDHPNTLRNHYTRNKDDWSVQRMTVS